MPIEIKNQTVIAKSVFKIHTVQITVNDDDSVVMDLSVTKTDLDPDGNTVSKRSMTHTIPPDRVAACADFDAVKTAIGTFAYGDFVKFALPKS